MKLPSIYQVTIGFWSLLQVFAICYIITSIVIAADLVETKSVFATITHSVIILLYGLFSALYLFTKLLPYNDIIYGILNGALLIIVLTALSTSALMSTYTQDPYIALVVFSFAYFIAGFILWFIFIFYSDTLNKHSEDIPIRKAPRYK